MSKNIYHIFSLYNPPPEKERNKSPNNGRHSIITCNKLKLTSKHLYTT